MENGKLILNLANKIGWSLLVLVIGLTTPSAGYAQACNPAVINYIVRDEIGQIVSTEELEMLAEQLPKQIGDATTSVSETSFAPDKRTFYWPESIEWQSGTKLPTLQFSNEGICAMRFSEVTLKRKNKTMRLIFDMEILRFQADRRRVIDSLPFQNGTFRLDLSNWGHERDQMIPALRWKRIRVR